MLLPVTEGALRFRLAAGAINRRSFGHTGAFLAGDFVGDVAKFVGPTALHRHVGKNEGQCGLQAFATDRPARDADRCG